MGEVRRRNQFRHDALHRHRRVTVDESGDHESDASRGSMDAMRVAFRSSDHDPISTDQISNEVTDDELTSLYPWPDDRPWVRANMVVTVDGRAQAEDGLTEGISSADDKRVFGWLRAMADVVVVGAGTVRSEGYHALRPKPQFRDLRAAQGRPPAPRLAIVTGSADLDPDSDPFTAPMNDMDVQRPLVLTTSSAPADRVRRLREIADVEICGEVQVDPHAAVDALIARHLMRILSEGGPTLLADFIAADLVDELDLTVSPLLLMQATSGLLAPSGNSTTARRVRLAHILEADSTLLLRYLLEPDTGG